MAPRLNHRNAAGCWRVGAGVTEHVGAGLNYRKQKTRQMTNSCQRITVERQRQEAWEAAVTAHVEALVSLGWKWEGKALRPRLNAALLHKSDSHFA